jgi:hypothetical protein
MWCGSDCRDLVFHAIEPLDKMGKLRRGIALHVLDLTRKFGDRAVRGVHCLALRTRMSSAIFCAVRSISASSTLSCGTTVCTSPGIMT